MSEYGRMPTYRQILSENLGYSSMTTVTADIRRLKEAGFLTEDAAGRTILVFTEEVRKQLPCLVGAVHCGTPTEAVEEIGEDIMSLLFDGKPERYTIITADGNSMTGKGIYDRDKLIVRKQPCAEPGEVVIAMIYGETTCKTLAKDEEGDYYLKAENPTFPDIHPDSDWSIIGVVKHVVHSM